MMTRRTMSRTADVCRVVLGLTFVFSGFVKTVDPWGTALKISEYLNVWGLGVLSPWRIGLSIGLCALELAMGLMLVVRIRLRLTSILALGTMSAFLVVTLLSATLLPVGDCGCFGDALVLSPWASVGKNVVLWALAIIVWLESRRRKPSVRSAAREWSAAAVLVCAAAALGVYCYRHLPLIDFLPYKRGTDLFGARCGGAAAESDIRVREFTVFDSAGDLTCELLGHPGRVYLLCASKLADITPRCAEAFETVATRASEQGARVVLLTSSPISAGETATFGAAPGVKVCNLDAGAMITMLRAWAGVVTLEDGVIVDKNNYRDIK